MGVVCWWLGAMGRGDGADGGVAGTEVGCEHIHDSGPLREYVYGGVVGLHSESGWVRSSEGHFPF